MKLNKMEMMAKSDALKGISDSATASLADKLKNLKKKMPMKASETGEVPESMAEEAMESPEEEAGEEMAPGEMTVDDIDAKIAELQQLKAHKMMHKS